jgi:hypothetical protein
MCITVTHECLQKLNSWFSKKPILIFPISLYGTKISKVHRGLIPKVSSHLKLYCCSHFFAFVKFEIRDVTQRLKSRGSVVGTAIGYELGDRGVGVPSPGKVKNILFSKWSSLALGSTPPPIQWIPGALSQMVKRPGREADHSPPASAEVKKMWIYTSTPHTPLWRSA